MDFENTLADWSFAGMIGVAQHDITPDPDIYCHNWGSQAHDRAEGIHMPLMLTAMSFRADENTSPLILMSMDFAWFPSYRMCLDMRQAVLEQLGLEDHQLMLCLTHSHAVPQVEEFFESMPGGDRIPNFRNKVRTALLQAAESCVDNAAPAILSWGVGHCTLARRRDYFDHDTGRVLCGMNPHRTPESTVLVGRVVEHSGEKMLATLVNYACHPVCLGGGNKLVSPDYVGTMREVVQNNTGGAPCLFLHGADGDHTPRDSYSSDVEVAERSGRVLGFAALSALNSLLPPAQQLVFDGVEVSGTDLARWKTEPYEVDGAVTSGVEYADLPQKKWPSLCEVEQEIEKATDRWALTRLRRLHTYLENLALLEKFPIYGMRLGRSVIIGIPAEPFSQLQVALRDRFPDIAVVVSNHANGSFNYLPPADYYGTGAYEQDTCDFGPGCLEIVIQGASRLIRRLMKSPDYDNTVARRTGDAKWRQQFNTWY